MGCARTGLWTQETLENGRKTAPIATGPNTKTGIQREYTASVNHALDVAVPHVLLLFASERVQAAEERAPERAAALYLRALTSSLIRWMWPRPRALTSQPSSK